MDGGTGSRQTSYFRQTYFSETGWITAMPVRETNEKTIK